MVKLNALLGRPVEYYEYPWAMEGRLRDAQSRFRSLFQPGDVSYIFAKSMPRSGHRFLSECLTHYFGPELHYCGFYWPGCCHKIPCKHPQAGGGSNRYFMQKSHDFGFRDSSRLNGKYLVQYRSPVPRLQSNYDLAVARGSVEQSKDSFVAFAERETLYFINFYRKWVTAPRLNAFAVAYEDLIAQQERTLAAVIGFITGDSGVNAVALARALAAMPVGGNNGTGGVRDPMQHPFFDPVLFARLEHKIAKECGKDRIRFHFL